MCHVLDEGFAHPGVKVQFSGQVAEEAAEKMVVVVYQEAIMGVPLRDGLVEVFFHVSGEPGCAPGFSDLGPSFLSCGPDRFQVLGEPAVYQVSRSIFHREVMFYECRDSGCVLCRLTVTIFDIILYLLVEVIVSSCWEID